MRGVTKIRSKAIASGLVLASLVLAGSVLAQQPTLKEVIGGDSKKKQDTAQPEQKPKPEAQPESKPKVAAIVLPDDEFNRGSPRTSVEGFLKAARERNYERAAQYLDLPNLSWSPARREGAQLARHLKIVLDRTLWIDLDRLSPAPEGYREDGLPPNRDLVGRIDL